MVSAFNSGASAPGLSPGQRHCVAFLGKTLHSHSEGEFDTGGNPAMD